MTTIEEIKTLDVSVSGSSGTIALATTLLSTDLILLIWSSNNASNTPTVNATNMTLHNGAALQHGSLFTFLRAYTITGVSGAGHGVTYLCTGNFHRLTVYVIRGLINPAITARSISTWTDTATPAVTDEFSSPTLAIGDGQLAIAVGVAESTTTGMVFPSNAVPATGWTLDRPLAAGNGRATIASRLITAPDDAVVGIRTTNSQKLAVALYVLGEAVAPIPPLESTFIGWGVDAGIA